VGTLGNSSPGVIVGPGLVNVDLGLFKFFQVRERLRLKLQATATNALNHPNLGNPNTDIMNGSNTSMRSIMLGARFDF